MAYATSRKLGDLMKPRSQPVRSELRLADLKARVRVSERLMNVKIPNHLADAIAKVARRLKASKTEVVIALLNEALHSAARIRARK